MNNVCSGGNTGAITFAIIGGNAPINVDLVGPIMESVVFNNTSVNTAYFDSLPAGAYTIYFNDQLGCSDSVTIVIQEPLPINISAVQQNVSCYNGGDGNILTSVLWWTPPYNYSWDLIGTSS